MKFRIASLVRRLLIAWVNRAGIDTRLYLEHAGVNVSELIRREP